MIDAAVHAVLYPATADRAYRRRPGALRRLMIRAGRQLVDDGALLLRRYHHALRAERAAFDAQDAAAENAALEDRRAFWNQMHGPPGKMPSLIDHIRAARLGQPVSTVRGRGRPRRLRREAQKAA